MTTDSTTPVDETTLFLGEAWSDPIEAGIRDRIRTFIEELIEEELAVALGRGRYERRHRRGDGEASRPPIPRVGAAYHMLKDGTEYQDLGVSHFDQRSKQSRRPERQKSG